MYGQGLRLATRLQIPRLVSYGYLQTAALHRRCGTNRLATEWLERARSGAQLPAETNAIAVQEACLSVEDDPDAALRALHAMTEGRG